MQEVNIIVNSTTLSWNIRFGKGSINTFYKLKLNSAATGKIKKINNAPKSLSYIVISYYITHIRFNLMQFLLAITKQSV